MPSLNNDLRVSITTAADNKGIKDTENSLKNLDDQSEKSGGHFKSLSDSFLVGQLKFEAVSKATEFFTDQLKECFTGAQEAAVGQAQLQNVLQSTHDVSGMTVESVNELAESIKKTTPIDDDAVLSAENMLLTFTSIGKDAFPDATRAVTDMATAMNNGATPSADQLKNTAIQVGKALNDPIAGVTALQRVGVKMTDTEKEQIATAMSHNDILGAQKVILGELSTEFGGSAQAAAGTFAGKMEMMKNNVEDVKKGIGKAIIEGIQPLATNLANFVNGDKFKEWIDKIPGYISLVMQKMQEFVSSKDFQTVWHIIGDAIKDLINVIKFIIDIWDKHTGMCRLVIQIIAAVLVAFYTLRTISAIIAGIQAVWEVFTAVLEMNPIVLIITAIIVVILLLAMHWGRVCAIFRQGWSDIQQWARDAWSGIVNTWNEVASWFGGLWGRISGGFRGAYNGMMQWARDCVNDIIGFFTGLPGRIGNVVGNVSSKIAGDIKGAFHSMHIPGFATGVTNFGGGMALVGENGPEYVNLPRGSSVYTNSQSQAMSGGSSSTITIQQLILPGVTDKQSFIQALDQDILLGSRGLSANRGAF